MFDFKFPSLVTPKRTAAEWAKFALTEFHNASAGYSNAVNRTFNDLIDSLGNFQQQQFFFDNFGKTIIKSEFSEDEVKSAMRWLADKLQGNLPKTTSMYFDGLLKEAKKISPLERIGRAAEELTTKAEAVVADASQGTIAALNVAKWVVPFALLAAAGYVLLARTKQIAGK